MSQRRRYPKILNLFKGMVAYRLSHYYEDRCDVKEFIAVLCEDFWRADDWRQEKSDRKQWDDEMRKELTRHPERNLYGINLDFDWRRFWRRFPMTLRRSLIKQAIQALRKEGRIAVIANYYRRPQFRRDGRYDWRASERPPARYWLYLWCENAHTALAALGSTEVPA